MADLTQYTIILPISMLRPLLFTVGVCLVVIYMYMYKYTVNYALFLFFPLLCRTQFYSLVHKERGEYSRGKESINGTSGMDLVIVNPPVGNTIEKGYFCLLFKTV